MAYNFSPFKEKIKGLEDWLRSELAGIRTGRATPAILDGVKIEAYGSMMPISQAGSIAVEDARMLRVTPWDMSLAKAVEKAIVAADLGLSVALDDRGVRVMFPELTSDRRAALIKVAKQKLEDARVTLRSEREKIIKDIETQEKTGTVSKDDKFRLKNELQKVVDDAGTVLEGMFEKKEKEIGE